MASPWYLACGPRQDLVGLIAAIGGRAGCFETTTRLAAGDGLLLLSQLDPSILEILTGLVQAHARIVAIVAPCLTLTFEDQWRLLAAGVVDIVHGLPDDQAIAVAFERLERLREVDRVVDLPVVRENAIGTSPRWREMLCEVVYAARYSQAPVLIEGESGSGKELVARLIHTLDPREDKRQLVVLDCTTVVHELSGSEFFGHERGAFTGAIESRDGAFAQADRGTLFMDEVGELPLAMQAQLLRVIQEKTYKRLGGSRWAAVNFRLIAATNRDLDQERQSGRFRSDLFYRLASLRLCVPPLRARREDILPLALRFMSDACRRPVQFDPVVASFLVERDYPGNVRELRQLIERMAIRHVGRGPVTIGALPADERPATARRHLNDAFEQGVRRALHDGESLKDIGRRAEALAEQLAIDAEQGNLQRAARRLGVTDRALQLRRQARRSRFTES